MSFNLCNLANLRWSNEDIWKNAVLISTLCNICNTYWRLIAEGQKDLLLSFFLDDFLSWIMLKGYPIERDSDKDMNWLCSFFILQCKCWPGFHLKDDGKTCVDIDECSLGFPCSQQCINTYGTYKCLCTDGYEIQPDNPNGCKSLSGIELNLSTDPASVIHIDPELYSYFFEFACCFWEIKILYCP